MTTILAIGIAAVALVCIRFALLLTRRRMADAWPVFPKRVLTAPEQQLFHRLQRAMPQHIVLAQVALSQIIGVRKGANFYAVFNRYNRLVVDFVICRPDFSVHTAIELDDRTHDHPRRHDADRRKSEILAAAGIPLLRINCGSLPSDAELVHLLAAPVTPMRGPFLRT